MMSTTTTPIREEEEEEAADAVDNDDLLREPLLLLRGDDDDDALEVVSNAHIHRRVIMPRWCGGCGGSVACGIRRTWISILLGFLVGGSTVLYLFATNKAISYFWKLSWNLDFDDPSPTTEETTTTKWVSTVLRILFAALLSGSLTRWFGTGERQIQNYFTTLPTTTLTVVEVILGSTICSIIAGAPLGPELTLVALANGLAQMIIKLFCIPSNTTATTNQNNHHDSIVDTEHQMMMIHASSLAAIWGGLVNLPIAVLLGPLVATELMTTTSGSRAWLLWLQLVSISVSSGTRQWLVGMLKMEEEHVSIVATGLVSSAKMMTSVLDWKHMVIAIPIGILCGLVGGCFHWMSRWLEKITIILRERTFSLLPTILAAILYSGIVLFNPSVIGSGWTIVQDFWKNTEDSISVDDNTDIRETIHDYGTVASIKFAAMLICVGLGGWPGGVITPMASIGACMGWILGVGGKMDVVVVAWLPATTMTVPCCTAACCVAMCSAPLSTVIAFLLVWNGALEQVPPILVSCVMATCITRMMVGVSQFQPHPSTTMPSNLERNGGGTTATGMDEDDRLLDHDYHDHNGVSNDMDDNELLRSVRSAIFGDAAFC
jgi:hypothetical protein